MTRVPLMVPQDTHHPGRTDTQTHSAWYKNFIVITIVPRQNYSSTNIIIQKIDSPAPNPTFCTRREAPSIERRGLSESSCPSRISGGQGGGAGCCFYTHPSLLNLGFPATAALHTLSNDRIADSQLRTLPLRREAGGRRRGRGPEGPPLRGRTWLQHLPASRVPFP